MHSIFRQRIQASDFFSIPVYRYTGIPGTAVLQQRTAAYEPRTAAYSRVNEYQIHVVEYYSCISTAVVCCICVQPRENGRAARGGLWTTATSNCHSYRRAYWYAQEIIPYYRYFVPVQPRGVGQILMT